MLALSQSNAAVGAQPSFVCPAPPSGWTAPKAPGFWGPNENPGTDTEEITCLYANSKGQSMSAVVSYALPTDLYPFNDFVYGCGSNGAVAWDDTQRIYHLPSSDRFALASFADPLKLLGSAEVPKFEALTHSMVDAAHVLAHNCSLKAAPTQTVATWLFDFDLDLRSNGVAAKGSLGTHVPQSGVSPGVASYAVPDGTFQTSGSPSNPVVTSLKAPPVTITLHDHRKTYTVTIAFTKGISFRQGAANGAGTLVASLVAGVTVVRSTLAGCRRGSQGTLTVATHPAMLKLDLCSSVFGALKSRAPRVDIERS
jgi:hypothetical protein